MISAPTFENPLLVGLLVDVSASMTSSIDNRSGRTQNRLEAFEETLRDLASKARSQRANKSQSVPIEVFCYGFGFGGLGTIFFGSSGPSVRDLFEGVSGQRPITLDKLSENWASYDQHVRSLAKEMFGATPMSSALDAAIDRFDRETRNKIYSGRILFILSDGEPTDGTFDEIRDKASHLRDLGTVIVSCYVTSQDITANRVLYERSEQHWPAGARLMLECASHVGEGSVFESHLKEYNWLVSPRSRIFCQINQTEILSEFMNLIISPFEQEDKRKKVAMRNIFLSYAHEDAAWLPKIEANLRPLVREGAIEIWSDKKIKAGDKWQVSIEKALERADVAIILVSPDFLASDFVANQELPKMLKSNEARGMRVIPILIRPSRFAQTPELAQFQSLNPPERTLAALKDWEQDQYLVELSNQIGTRLA